MDEKQQAELAEIEKAKKAELEEIWNLLQAIRRATGYGSLVIELRAGAPAEYQVTTIIRPKMEKKTNQFET